jgi:uncharacterized membrane protein YsdA (DUF1294 family)
VEQNPNEKEKKVRIPEFSLLFLALIGGSLGAILAMLIPPHHKTSQSSFKTWLALILAAQLVALIYFRDQVPWI